MPINFGPPSGGSFGFMSSLIPFFIGIVFVIIISIIIFQGVRYMKNAAAQPETVHARIIAKRMDVRNYMNHHSTGTGVHSHLTSSSRTQYFITLEFENGERQEYLDKRRLYGLVTEGDTGYASVQGDWIIGFERNKPQSQ